MVSKKSRTEVRVKKHNRMRNHLAGTATASSFSCIQK